MVWSHIRADILSILIWLQTVCKGFQQMTKDATSKERVKESGKCKLNGMEESTSKEWVNSCFSGSGERDMILMQHDIGVQWGDGSLEDHQLSLVAYGDVGGFSAMAKTVGLPTGIATKMVLTGTYKFIYIITALTVG